MPTGCDGASGALRPPDWAHERERRRGREPAQDLPRRRRGAARGLLRHPPRRDVRGARAERRRQEHRHRDPRGLPRPHERRSARARRRSAPRRTRLEGAARHRAAEHRRGAHRHRAGAARPLRLVLPAAPRRRRGHRVGGADREGQGECAEAVGRAASSRRRGTRHHRSPRAAVPRRADDGLRPRGAAAVLGPHPPSAERGHLDPADHPLPRRGLRARGTRGDHRRRGGGIRRPDRRPRRSRGARADRAVARGRRGARGAHHEPGAVVAELVARGGEPERLEIVRPSLEDVYLSFLGDEARRTTAAGGTA